MMVRQKEMPLLLDALIEAEVIVSYIILKLYNFYFWGGKSILCDFLNLVRYIKMIGCVSSFFSWYQATLKKGK